jgi:hypothetical protein
MPVAHTGQPNPIFIAGPTFSLSPKRFDSELWFAAVRCGSLWFVCGSCVVRVWFVDLRMRAT